MNKRKGRIAKINGNMIGIEADSFLIQNEVGYVIHKDERLKAEVIRIRGRMAEAQVYENTGGLRIGDEVEFTDELLSIELGPGLLGKIVDGLQNPLPQLAEKYGFFLKRGVYLDALPADEEWDFTPMAKVGDKVLAGDRLGMVPEKIFSHFIMVPFGLKGVLEITHIASRGRYNLKKSVAKLRDQDGREHNVCLVQRWPVKVPIEAYVEKLMPEDPLVTKIRLIDSLFPVARGGTYCIPGPFGAGKTVLQQLTSRHAEVDVVVIAACGERAGEVVETLKTFPQIIDPRTDKPLIDRTVIICNTSSMPVAARESSVYTAVTIAEYYRQMGLSCFYFGLDLKMGSGMRKISGRLEEIPGEAFQLTENRIAAFMKAGMVKSRQLHRIGDNKQHSKSAGEISEPVAGYASGRCLPRSLAREIRRRTLPHNRPS